MLAVNVNQADENQLVELEHVGPVLAERISNYRDSNGGFDELTDLKEVKGIGDKLYSDIKAENELSLDSISENNKQVKDIREQEEVKEAKVDLDIPSADRVEVDQEEFFNNSNKTVKVDNKSREEFCPALRSCSVYKEEYCEGNYEECARYKIISSPLSFNQVGGLLLPHQNEKAKTILENNL